MITDTISPAQARLMWARIGLLSFGGPAGQIALLHREVVERRKLIEDREFLGALNFCMLLPGPEAMQLATWLGWRLHGVRGGLTAGLLFILPGALVLYALSALYVLVGQVPLVAAAFWGVKAAVLSIVIEALMRVAKRALKGPEDWVTAFLAFAGLFVFAIPFPLIIATAALAGFLSPAASVAENRAAADLPGFRKTSQRLALWLAIWLGPLAALHVGAPGSVYAGLGDFFAKLAAVTFGGAYAVLSYMAQDVVEARHWLTGQQMIDGLGLAETTPGPLILVGQYVGFIAAAQAHGSLWAGFAGGAIFLWMTFAPCFLWVFVFAPYLEWVKRQARLSAALARVTAAVVGVILNLSLWFALQLFFGKAERLQGPVPLWWPHWQQLDVPAIGLSALAAFALLGLHWSMLRVLGAAALLGLLWKLGLPMIQG